MVVDSSVLPMKYCLDWPIFRPHLDGVCAREILGSLAFGPSGSHGTSQHGPGLNWSPRL